jgi:hypothetical protein
MRFLGRISYSLYLWHWPILVLPATAIDGGLSLAARLALVGVSIAVAAASQRWVEDPIRHGRFVGRRVGRTLALAGATSLAVALLAVGVGTAAEASLPATAARPSDDPNKLPVDPFKSPAPSAGVSARPGTTGGATASNPPSWPASPPASSRPPTPGGAVPAGLEPSLAGARDDAPIIYSDGCHVDQHAVEPRTCVFGDTTSTTSVVLLGDSHAAQWFPTLARLATVEHWRFVTLTKSACAPADLTVWNPMFQRAYTECDAWRANAFDQITALHPSLVVMAMSRIYTVVDGATTASVADRPDLWDAGIAKSLARLVTSADHVALVGDTPRSRFDPPACLSKHLDDVLACATPASRALDPTRTAADRALADAAGVTFVDPTPWVCPTEPCPVVIGTYLVFRDNHHLATPFATALARRMLAALPPPLGVPSGG